MKFKFIKIIMIICIISLTFSGAVNASNISYQEPELVTRVVINELEFIRDLQSMTDNDLIENGLTEAEIKELRNIDIENILKERINNSSEFELRNMGYSDDLIEMVKNKDFEEHEVLPLFISELTLSIYKRSSNASSSYSYLNLMVEWEWSVMPVFTRTDAIAFAWSKGYSSSDGGTYNIVNYQYLNNNRKQKTYYITGKEPGIGCHIEFPLTHPDDARYVGKSGTVYLSLYDYSYIGNAEVLVKYGHTTITIGSISVSYPGGVSVEFGFGIDEISKWYNYIE